MTYFGTDVHSKYSEICGVSDDGEIEVRTSIPTTEASVRRFFGKLPAAKVIFECGPVGPWFGRLLRELGHDAVMVSPRRLRLIAESTLKTDRADAEILARVGRLDLGFLRPVYQRSEAAQELRSHLRIRTMLVRSRVAMISSVRAELRQHGYRMKSCTAARFAAVFQEASIPRSLRLLLDPLLETMLTLNQRIEELDKELGEKAATDETCQRLQTVPGVGPIVSLAFMAWMDDPHRFKRSRDVGACLGLRPRLRASADMEKRGRITREGDCEMRRLLVQAGHALLLTNKQSHLRKWAGDLVERIGKKKAIVAAARKIAVLLHRLWVSGETFRPMLA